MQGCLLSLPETHLRDMLAASGRFPISGHLDTLPVLVRNVFLGLLGCGCFFCELAGHRGHVAQQPLGGSVPLALPY